MSGIVVVAENGKGRYQQAVAAGQHQLIADEPASMGGGDAGPAPFDFIMSGLGACTSMTLPIIINNNSNKIPYLSK